MRHPYKKKEKRGTEFLMKSYVITKEHRKKNKLRKQISNFAEIRKRRTDRYIFTTFKQAVCLIRYCDFETGKKRFFLVQMFFSFFSLFLL